MLLRLPHNLHFPITVTKLLKRPNDNVEQNEPLFAYFYKTTVTEGDEAGNRWEVEKTFPTNFESSVEGVVRKWEIAEGDVIILQPGKEKNVIEIEEPCAHEVQWGGMCANCGKDMTETSYNTDVPDVARAPIRMTHDSTSLTVSEKEATQIEEKAKRRLLAERRLSLVVDLDQTIIQATVDPTVGEWQQDKDNPNHEAVKDVRAFQLVDDGPGMRGCWYYIKLRPGLKDFLQEMTKLYQLHIYTMGTRAYATNIAKIVDPEEKIFADRILSRDESGSLTAKNLERLFPVDTKMVVIIDDRGDVWKWSPNLIKVTPYDFFIGIGDINASFLPKLLDTNSTPKALAAAAPDPNVDLADDPTKEEREAKTNGVEPQKNKQDESTDVSALETLVTMGGGDDPTLRQVQASKQEETISHQVADRPLLQRQKQLDAEDEAAAEAEDKASAESSTNGEKGEPTKKRQVTPEAAKHHRRLLQDNDRELFHLEQRLRGVHQAFFDEYDRNRIGGLGGRISALRGEPKAAVSEKGIDLTIVPDVKVVMPQMKLPVLQGVVLVLSGVLPLGTDIQNADISVWARSFGATIVENVSKHTTHLIAARNRTQKVRQAARRPHIKIVTTPWLIDSITQWKWLDEEPYLIPVHPEDRGKHAASSSPGSSQEAKVDDGTLLSSSGEDDTGAETDEEAAVGNNDASKLKIKTDDLNATEDDAVLPSSTVEENSPLGGYVDDWEEMDKEAREFLGSDYEDSDTESVTSTTSEKDPSTRRQRKRKRADAGEDSDNEGGAADAEGGGGERGSRLAQKVKRTHERETGLKQVKSLEEGEKPEEEGEREMPDANGDGVDETGGIGDGGKGEDQAEDDSESDDELARAMEAELAGDSDDDVGGWGGEEEEEPSADG